MQISKNQKVKLVLTSLLSSLSIILFIISPSITKFICIFAMIFSSIGDIMLMNLKVITRHVKADIFLVGMLSFGVAHLLYILLYTRKAFELNCKINEGTIIAAFAVLSVIILLIVLCIAKRSLPLPFVFVGILYILILSTNLSVVSTIAFSTGGKNYLTLLGATAFFVSDLIIAFNKVNNRSGFQLPIWILYVTGQLFLIIGA